METVFNNSLVKENLGKLLDIEKKYIKPLFITKEGVDETIKVLQFEKFQDVEDIRAIRNSLVKTFSDLFDNIQERIELISNSKLPEVLKANTLNPMKHSARTYLKCMTAFSSVCDNYMISHFPE